jgi:hypothetical protein
VKSKPLSFFSDEELRVKFSTLGAATAALIKVGKTVPRDETACWDRIKNLHNPEKIYSEMICKSKVNFPYLTLDQMKESDIILQMQTKLSVSEGICRRPHQELDDNFWYLLFLQYEILGWKIQEIDAGKALPEVSNASLLKENKWLNWILVRIIQLVKNPSSVTLKGIHSKDATPSGQEAHAKRLVDLAVCRRRWEMISHPSHSLKPGYWKDFFLSRDPVSKKSVLINSSRFLKNHLRSLHEEDKDLVILYLDGIINIVAQKMTEEPSAFYETSDSWTKSRLRQGPRSKTRSGKTRSNLYIPFGFYKGKKFSEARKDFPETQKAKLAVLADKSYRLLESISQSDISYQPEKCSRLIEAVYACSDELNRSLKNKEDKYSCLLLEECLTQGKFINLLERCFTTTFVGGILSLGQQLAARVDSLS